MGRGGRASEDKEDILNINQTDVRMLRGSSFLDTASFVRSANRIRLLPATQYYIIGFRVARTVR
jgi:formylglycine-generating enzyme required for sulfatase activity